MNLKLVLMFLLIFTAYKLRTTECCILLSKSLPLLLGSIFLSRCHNNSSEGAVKSSLLTPLGIELWPLCPSNKRVTTQPLSRAWWGVKNYIWAYAAHEQKQTISHTSWCQRKNNKIHRTTYDFNNSLGRPTTWLLLEAFRQAGGFFYRSSSAIWYFIIS